MFANTRQVQLGPTKFFFHRDLSGEVALAPDDEPVLCQECSTDQVRAGMMECLGEAPQDEQCRMCGRFSWGRVESYQIREPRAPFDMPVADARLQLANLQPVTTAIVVEELTTILDEEGQRLTDLGQPPSDPEDYRRTMRRIAALTVCKAIVQVLQLEARADGEGLALLRELYGFVVEHTRGYGELSAPHAPFANILDRAAAFLGVPAPKQ